MIYQKALRSVVYPIWEMKQPKDARAFEILRLLEKTQWWPPPKLEQFQQQRLQALLRHAYENVAYYHRVFNQLGLRPGDIKSTGDLQQLPILTKDTIRNNLDDLVARNYPRQKVYPGATGGSTGEPLRFFVDRRSGAWNVAAAYREWGWAGYNVGDRMAYLWGSPQDLSYQAKFKFKIFDFIRRIILLDAFNMTERDLEEYVQVLRKFKPKVINAYTSAVYLMARYMEQKGISDVRPKAILLTTEMLFAYQRETIERAFGCPVFDYYGSREVTLQAGECPEHSGYHLAVENGLVEFVRDGKDVAPGELGKIVITDLCNYAMPFIRYETGDLGVLSDEMCPCGRGLPLMKSIEGRTTDILRRDDGGYVSSPGLTVVIKDFRNIKQIQIIQKIIGHVTLKVVKGESYSDKDSELLEQVMKRYLGSNTQIDMCYVDSIPVTPSGKYRFTISEVPIEF